jgi:hypothetical protein
MILSKPKESTTMEFRNPDAGSYLGRCISVIDLGTQTTTWEGQTKQQHKVILNFELFGEDSQGVLEIDSKPLAVYKRYTLSNHEKSTLMVDLKSWKGKEVELPLDLNKLLGQFAMVNVIHNEYQGKTYANIGGLSQVPTVLAKAGFPKGFNEPFLFDLSKHPVNFDKVWAWQQEMIKKSAEWVNTEAKREATTLVDDDVPF